MKTKYVCRGLISLYVYCHNNWTMWSLNLHERICRWGGGGGGGEEKEPKENDTENSRKLQFRRKKGSFPVPPPPPFQIL